MKVHYLIASEENCTVLLRSRKIAKALYRRQDENGFTYKNSIFCN